MLLLFMVIFIVSGYAWSNRIIMPVQMARYMHTQLDIVLVFFFLAHTLIGIRLALTRWRVGHSRMISGLLVIVGVLSFWLVFTVR